MAEYVYKSIGSITFGLFSPEQIKKISATKIVTPELYDKEGYPVDGGLMDVHLGIIDPGLRCKTCGGKLKQCTGHFGHIELARPVIHIKYVKQILDVLKCTCRECGKVLLPEEEIKNYVDTFEKLEKKGRLVRRRRLTKELINKLKNLKKCPHCSGKQYVIKLEKPATYMERDKRLNPIELRARLEKVPNDDSYILGLNPAYVRPEWMVLNILSIPPVTIRPSITLETGERSEDDLTHKLGDIVRINQRLFENINAGAPEVIIEDLWDLLQYHIITYFDNSLAQVPPARHRSGQPLKTLTERIKSKEGRFRHNLAGKRVNFAGRTVISPDPQMDFNEVGVPKQVAYELTVPERVNDWNKEWLKRLIKNGPKKYPGANYVLRPDGKKKRITEDTVDNLLEELDNGFIVERHIMDGDIAIFNRQPSLHRMSIMCHKIKLLPGKSFRLNPSVCVAPNTKVDLSSGIKRKIDELKNCWKESELSTFDWTKKQLMSTELKKFWGLKPEAYNAKCYKLSTDETGRTIIATGDHPFYTDRGVKPAKDIKVGNKVMVRPLDTPEYKETDKIIVKKRDIRAPNTYIKHSLKILEELELVPLNMKDQRIMILARLLGHLFGDGTFILKKDVARLMFRGTKEDLEIIQNDIKSLGFEPEKIYIRSSDGEIRTIKGKKLRVIGSGASFEVRNKPLALLFGILGAPNGDKVKNDFSVPKWILNAPDYIKREFIGAYFGSELSSPALRKKSKTNFKTLKFKLSKIREKVNSGMIFINQIKNILKEFEINVTSISKEPGNIRKDGFKTVSLTANITSNKSGLNLFGKIGYIYSKLKDNKARLAYQYSLLKEKEIKKRKEAYKKLFEMRKKGYKFKQISKTLGLSVSMLENWAYGKYNAGLLSNFIGFENWCELVTKKIDGTGLIWETISKKENTYCPFVYDVTTIKDTHNFFANGFLTKNCAPYNADFDGDEMNLHIPQTEEARAEADILMQVQTQIMSPKHGKNVIGCIEDSITGNYLLTKDSIFSKEEAYDLLLSVGLDKLPNFSGKVSGKEIFSSLLPKDFNYIGYSRHYRECVKCVRGIHHDCRYDSYVFVKNGKLISGVIDSASIGEESGALLRDLYRKYGPEITIDIIGKIFRLGIKILLKFGFSTVVSDTDLPSSAKDEINGLLRDAERNVYKFIELFDSGKLEALPGKTISETLEVRALELLNKVRNKIGDIVSKYASDDNPTLIMANSGAKGNLLNLAQMAACVGQQALMGKRIEKGYNDRTLSLFKAGDLGPEARGFVGRGFKDGLKPTEFFFHAMTGRDALMDTALRTPKSGYLYRRLSNALQDLKVEYDGTVRDANKSIIQFSYGEDGIDVSKSEAGSIDIVKAIKDVIGE